LSQLPEPVRESLIELLSDHFAELIRGRPDLAQAPEPAEDPPPPGTIRTIRTPLDTVSRSGNILP